MAGVSDIRDIMELSAPTDAPRPAKRVQQAAPAPRLTGISREVYALMGDRAPPIPLAEQKYKSKPKYQQKDFKPRRWEQRAFVNGARKDGLVLRHWKLSNPVASGETIPLDVAGDNAPAGEEVGGMVIKSTADGMQTTVRYSDEFPMEKFNVKVEVPKYTDEQYEQHLKSDAWTKAETDYLMELCRDYDLRWFVITDRWNFDTEEGLDEDRNQSSGDAMAVDGSSTIQESKKPKWPPSRTMEQLKSRYYTVAAAMLAVHRPPHDMLPSEYALWERMQKFDANMETQRKKLAEALFSRSEDEATEERLLLAELKRIVDAEDQFLAERRDIYNRLESVPSHRREGDQSNYSSSAHLSALLQNLLAKEKRGKIIRAPESAAAGNATQAPAEPQRTQSWEKGSHPNQYTRRNTLTEDGEQAPQKKGQAATNIRKLSPAEEAKFGVSHHDRLTSGVSFRYEKVVKMSQGKSQAQTAKLQSALTELRIPPRLLMPTEKVCREFERLISKVNLLLDVRKLREKVKSEVDVLEEARRIRLGIPKEPAEGGDTMDLDKKNGTVGEPASMENKNAEATTNGEASNPGDEDLKTETVSEKDKPSAKLDGENSATGETAEDEVEESKVDLDEEENAEEDGSEAEAAEAEDEDQEEQDEDEGQSEDDEGEEGLEEDLDDEEPDIDINLGEDNDEDEDIDNAEDDIELEDQESDEEDDMQEKGGSDNEEEEDQAEAEKEGQSEESGGEAEEPSGPPSVATRAHKRSASVLSEGSRAGSNRSGTGRKRSRK